MRLTDVCTRLDDTIAIAALYLCTLSMLTRLRRQNQRWRVYPRSLVNENRWLAQRFGTDEGMVDFGLGQRKNFHDLMDELLEYLREDAERFDCVAEIEHARVILQRGTSAHQQIRTFREAMAGGADKEGALRAVVDMLIETTREGIEVA
jgi:carboxylate-amine ligase